MAAEKKAPGAEAALVPGEAKAKSEEAAGEKGAAGDEKAALWSGPMPPPLLLKNDMVVLALPQAGMDDEPVAAPSPTRSRGWLLAALIVALALLVAVAIGYFLRRRRVTQNAPARHDFKV